MFSEAVEKGFVIENISIKEDRLIYRVIPKYSHEESFSILLREIRKIDKELIPYYRRSKEHYEIIITRNTKKKRKIKSEINLILLILTLITTTLAGYIFWAKGSIKDSMIFSFSLLTILGVHELGHAITARRSGVEATLPIFIPVPPPIFPFGTLGAVIFMNSPVPNRKTLVDIGISGPVAGFCLSIPIAIIGLAMSRPESMASIPKEEFVLGPSLLFYLFIKILFPDLGNKILVLHPLAIAGWAGIFVTSLNIIPVGQLDGGHVIRGIFPEHYKKIYIVTFLLLLIAGFFWPGWIVWAIFVYFLTRLRHPGPMDDVSQLDRKRKFMLLVMLVILIMSFMPIPIIPGELLSKNI